jgi:hypothetical protein
MRAPEKKTSLGDQVFFITFRPSGSLWVLWEDSFFYKGFEGGHPGAASLRREKISGAKKLIQGRQVSFQEDYGPGFGHP